MVFLKRIRDTILILEKRWKNDRLCPLKSDLSSCAFRFHIFLENLETVSWFKDFFNTARSVLNNHDLLDSKFDNVMETVRNELSINRLHEVC
jgi:hypothetical protein